MGEPHGGPGPPRHPPLLHQGPASVHTAGHMGESGRVSWFVHGLAPFLGVQTETQLASALEPPPKGNAPQ